MHRARLWAVPLAALALLTTTCGTDGDPEADSGPDLPVSVEAVLVADRVVPTAADDPAVAGATTLDLGHDLLGAITAAEEPDTNVVISPMSIATALGMLEPGTIDDAQTQVRDLLGIEDPAAYHASMNALEQSLEGREPSSVGAENDPGEITVRIANAAYLQQGLPFEPDFLEVIGRHYGPVLNEVDFPPDPDAVAHEINRWVADNTEDRITDLIPDEVLTADTILALVNALYLHASWFDPFDPAETVDQEFTRRDGTEVTVPMMHGHGDQSAEGDGWVGATKIYTGGLAAQFILPDEGRFGEIADDLPGAFADLEAGTDGAELVLPRFETRSMNPLTQPLKDLGVTAPFERGHLRGIVDDDRVVVSDVLHETYLAMDEEGTEAAAATVVVLDRESGPASPPVPVILDRPFLFRIVDTETGATLFLGRIMDPTA